ncbi:MAG: hypothetical protein MST07_03190 [Firmicutes bacterium]|nr:hypothetical protein [Bacillota bacterium]
MTKLSSTRGLSRIELICIIVIIAVLLIAAGLWWHNYRVSTMISRDNLTLRRALSYVETEWLVTDGASNVAEDRTAYFDAVLTKLTEDKPAGYNEYHTMTIDGRTYEGERNTMVIKATLKDGNLRLDWVKGEGVR